MPEKAQKQYNFCLIPFPIPSTGNENPAEITGGSTTEPFVWAVNDGVPLPSQLFGRDAEEKLGGSQSLLEDALEYAMHSGRVKISHPVEAEFVSATPEAHRNGERAYHVKAFRGSKDGKLSQSFLTRCVLIFTGYLFFLSNGIFFGFKKPLLFFPLDDIKAISYTSVLQRTFNLNILCTTGHPATGEQELEFSMIDQANFAGIDAYVKRHELQDVSMAESRKAKKLNLDAKKGPEPGSRPDGHEPNEGAEASHAMEDSKDEEEEEEEEEEDYHPGSERASEGSGTSSDEEDPSGDGAARAEYNVEDELGSEARDLEPVADGDGQL